ncbi:activator-dependent family glycosyltransferase [Streptomyces corynorhini]|uniref:Activator-dependent family glycosyltransferase n=2 Tax=Streptomyces corynorhini TaxID=2282652 RepID=A0A370BCI2_9ACTN|nr:activator-dependent family glycosyltransferase [Streptomyces corynorhini]
MRVLFVTLSEKSHVYLMAPLAWALTAAGHDVRMASQPMATDTITRAGLTAVPVGSDHGIHQDMTAFRESQDYRTANWSRCERPDVDWAELKERYELSVPYAFAVYNDSMIEDLAAFAQDWRPDVVVRDPLAYAGAVAARVAGAAHVRLMWCADVWGRTRQTYLELMNEQPEAERTDPLAQWLGSWSKTYGFSFDEEMVQGQATISTLPASLALPTASPELPMRHIPYNGRAVVWDWLREPPKRPRICLSLGASNTEDYGGDYVSVPEILDALAEDDVEVVAALLPVQREALGTLPANARAVDSVALHTLLPTCSAIIHHGGYGSFATAMAHGVPQLMLSTMVSDHELRGRALQRVGAGVYVHHGDVTAEKVRDHLRRFVGEPGHADAARRLREEAEAMPSPREVVTSLERLAKLS